MINQAQKKATSEHYVPSLIPAASLKMADVPCFELASTCLPAYNAPRGFEREGGHSTNDHGALSMEE